jgi:hypothetical protein
MNDSSDGSTDSEGSGDEEIVHRTLDPDRDDPAVEVAEIVADLEGTTPAKLPATYNRIDHVVDHIFSDPPAPEAQIMIEFTYGGYRITVKQDGTARFVKVG